MVQFDEAFFMDEIRDGWLVRSDMKRMWAAEIEVLMEIDRVCKKYNILYFADFGTLLGAVRHNGYIPWDDDMDIVMFRDAYMKFLSIADNELEYPLICANIYRKESWLAPFARVMNGTGINFDRRFLERYHGCSYSAGVDIFVLDDMPECEDEFYLIRVLFMLGRRLGTALENLEDGKVLKEGKKGLPEDEIDNYICQIEELCKVAIDRKKNIMNQLLRIVDGFGALNAGNQSDEVFDISFIPHNNYFYAGSKKEWYRKAIMLPFENIVIPVPIGYDKVLRNEFGNYRRAVKNPGHDIYYRMEQELRTVKKDVRNMNKRIGDLEGILE